MSQLFRYPNSSASVSISAIGTNGTPIPATSIQVGGEDPSGNLQPIQVNGSGELIVAVGSSALPTGASTAARQDAQTALLTTIDSSNASIDSKTPALVSGRVPVDGSGVTQPISAASLPLPTGAATSALQTSGNASLTSIDSKLTSPLAVTGTFFQATQPVSIAATVAISAASLPLPTGAATEATLSALNTKVPSQGQAAMAASMPVVIASDQSAIPVTVSGSIASPTGRAKANPPTYSSYSGTPVTSAAYVQIIASTASAANLIEIFDSSGEPVLLAVGAAASEVDQFIVYPGGNGQVPLAIPAGSRISLKSVATSNTVGFIVINLYT